MSIRCTGTAQVRIDQTGEVLKVPADELRWEVIDGADDRGMGPEYHWQASAELSEGHRVIWHVWEYPDGVENMIRTDTEGGVTLLKDIDYGLASDDDYDYC